MPEIRSKAQSALEILEEAVDLLRNASASAMLWYLCGAVPFLLALLFFPSEMMRSPFAEERLAMESLGVAALFLWKRICQAVFAAQLNERLSGRGFELRNLPRLIAIQCAVQPLRVLALPIGLLMTVPFAGLVAFFRNAGLFAALGEPRPVHAAHSQAALWTRQNWGILAVAAGAAVLLFLNVTVLLVLLPQLARSFLGVEGDFARLGVRILNAETLAVAAALTWLAVDPLLEAAYVLRCFYGASIASGEDLRSALRRVATIAALLLIALAIPPQSFAQDAAPPSYTIDSSRLDRSTIDSSRLDRSIDEVIRRREFTWRAVRPAAPGTEREWPGWLQSVSRALHQSMDWIARQLKRLFDRNQAEPRESKGATERPPIEVWSVAVALALVVAGVVLYLRRNRSKPAGVTPVQAPAAPLNLADDSVTADQLSESSWLALADEWLSKGDNRLALRALYLAGLNYLGQRELVSIARFKTGLDYRRELERRSRAATGVSSQVVPVFQANNALFERGWYGRHNVEREHVEAFVSGLDEMRRFAPGK